VSPRDPTRRTTKKGRLVDRVIRQRRDTGQDIAVDADDADDHRRIAVLEGRVEELEALLVGLQDSVHREMIRHDRQIGALTERTQAPEMARALDRYSRKRGI
jgi:hypothetical protein